ncbi:hypothetical protein B0H16DRAFT_1727287 [Mycena metata]|uniref:Uncharacterized protein n=1 Tax=Mycena metata TaxID=1033252 RepID=A0AAD7IJ64_9AGAR|nr:hypothetical protein B0H16DRAFT_1727287 [Mycena metata]
MHMQMILVPNSVKKPRVVSSFFPSAIFERPPPPRPLVYAQLASAAVALCVLHLSFVACAIQLRRAARSPALLSFSTHILFYAPLLMSLAGVLAALNLLTLLVHLPLSGSWYAQLASPAVALCTLHLTFVGARGRAIQRSTAALLRPLVLTLCGLNLLRAPASSPPSCSLRSSTKYQAHRPRAPDTALTPNPPSSTLNSHAALLCPLRPLVLIALTLSGLNVLRALVYLPLTLLYRVVALFAALARLRRHPRRTLTSTSTPTRCHCPPRLLRVRAALHLLHAVQGQDFE